MGIIRYQKGNSFWMASSVPGSYPKLEGDIETDVAVVGGGIAGLSTAYFLKKQGLRVTVLEKEVIGGGTTGHTTGKVSSLHNLTYAKMQKRFGKEIAKLYGEANQSAVEQVRSIVQEEKIDCDWRDEDNYVFTEDPGQVETLKKEASVAAELGLPAFFETDTPLPWEIRGAVRFADQGTFHARKYVFGLAKAIDGGGSHVFEHTQAEHFSDGDHPFVRTKSGVVRAKSVVVATLVPYRLTTHTAYALVEYPLSSYIVAMRGAADLKGMYITPDKHTYSILPVESEGEKLLLIGGQSHIPGLGRAQNHYERLIRYGKEKFGATATDFRWLAWDYVGYDKRPVIGKLYPWSKNVYTATGFLKWGLSNGTAAGMILSDLITKGKSPWLQAFDSMRGSTIRSIPRFLAEFPRLIG